MQVCKCTVRLSGKVDQEIIDKTVTVAEIQVLRSIHGADAVRDVVPVNFDTDRSNAAELERLAHTYGAKALTAVYPGFQPMLPTTLRDIGLDTRAEAKALREKAKGMLELADQMEAATGNAQVTTDKSVKAPKTPADIFADAA